MYVLSAGKREVHLIVGIVVPILVVALIVGLALFYYRRVQKRAKENRNEEQRTSCNLANGSYRQGNQENSFADNHL